jgi:transposase
MTDHGEKLSGISSEEVVDRLQDESDSKAIKRLVAAREYLDGHSPASISEKFGWPEQTVYSWLDRLESSGLEGGLYDDPPPGRPSALDEDEFKQFRSAVQHSPENVGIDAPAWSTALAQQYLRNEFDHEFSRRHVRRLLKRAGLSWQTPRPQPPTADDEERSEFREDLKKTDSDAP